MPGAVEFMCVEDTKPEKSLLPPAVCSDLDSDVAHLSIDTHGPHNHPLNFSMGNLCLSF